MKKIKRKEGDIASWISLILTLGWFIFGVCIFRQFGFEIGGFGTWLVCLLFPACMMLCTFSTKEHYKTIEFIIYEYERWDKKTESYIKKYFYDNKVLLNEFVLTFHIGSCVEYMDKEKLEAYVKRMGT